MSLASAAGAAVGDDASFAPGAGAAAYFSRDNEGFATQRAGVEYLPRFAHGNSLGGVRYTAHHYDQGDWSRTGQQLSFLHRDVDPATANGWQLDAGLFRQGGHDLLTADGNYRAALAGRTAIEGFVNREWVETATALDRGIHLTFAGGALEQGIGPHVTVIGLAGLQTFSDGNYRNHGRARLIVQPNLDLGLTLQLRYRVYKSAREDVEGAYFNPGRYDETLLAVGWRQRFLGWTGRLTTGAGTQHVGHESGTPTRLLELVLQSPPIRAYSVGARAGFNQSASFNGPDYRYHYVQGELILGF